MDYHYVIELLCYLVCSAVSYGPNFILVYENNGFKTSSKKVSLDALRY